MRTTIIPVVLLLTACGTPPQQVDPPPTPAVFQDHSVLKDVKTRMYSDSRSGNVVEALFQEELERDTVLASLVQRMKEQDRAHMDSMQYTNSYLVHNRDYYAEATFAGKQISNTLLAAPIINTIRKDESRYMVSIKRNEDLAQRYDSVQQRDQDLLTVIKLKRTLRIMRSYQDADRPPIAALEREVQRISELEKELMEQLER